MIVTLYLKGGYKKAVRLGTGGEPLSCDFQGEKEQGV
jgi:hypothetical protein